MMDTLAALPPAQRRDWWLGAAAWLAIVLLYLALEALWTRRRVGLAGWAVMRIMGVVAIVSTFAAVWLPARAVSGFGGLAVFYGLLFTVAPLLWFGLHRLGGHIAGAKVSVWLPLAVSSMLIAAFPIWTLQFIEPAVRTAAREIGARGLPSGPSDPLPYDVGPVRAFNVPTIGIVLAQSLHARPEVRLTLIEERHFGQWSKERMVSQRDWCRAGQDIHLLWAAGTPAPYLRLHWADGVRQLKAEHTPKLAAFPAPEPFMPTFRVDGFDVPVPVPIGRVDLRLRTASGAERVMLQLPPQAGELPAGNCLLPGYRFRNPGEQGEVDAFVLTYQSDPAAPPRRGVILRTGAPPYR